MKVVILAGGLGSRLSEITKKIPKPMIKIGKEPIIVHIMNTFLKYGFNEFIIASGYKSFLIERFFKKNKKDYKVKIVNTGIDTMTGGRLIPLKKILKKERFFLTYGDGVSNINIKKLLKFHIKNNKIGTVTAVHPVARFGEIVIKKNLVKSFKEKPQTKKDWINGGFFIFEPSFLNLIKNKNDILEGRPLESLSRKKQLSAYKHTGFWQCMDTKRDRDYLEKISRTSNPWS
tara:strand:- start:271 stop:963 length:693 start_codon:yes stop_codon:yes gene_type:complete